MEQYLLITLMCLMKKGEYIIPTYCFVAMMKMTLHFLF